MRRTLTIVQVPVLVLALLVLGGPQAAAGPPQAQYVASITQAGPNGTQVCYATVGVTWKSMPARVTRLGFARQLADSSWLTYYDRSSAGDFKAGRSGSDVYDWASLDKLSTSTFRVTLYSGRDPSYTSLGTTDTVTVTFGGTNGCTPLS